MSAPFGRPKGITLGPAAVLCPWLDGSFVSFAGVVGVGSLAAGAPVWVGATVEVHTDQMRQFKFTFSNRKRLARLVTRAVT